jgi:transposase-like protein
MIKCVNCGKSNYKKKGFRKTQNRGKIQKFFCFECNRYFTNDEGFYRMRNSEKKITSAIDLYFSNLSSRKVRNHFRRHWEHNASHETILNWCRKYTLKVHKYVDSLKPKLSGKYYADETEIDREGENDKFWACVDWETRMIVDTHYSLTANIEEAKEFLTKLKAKGIPKFIMTDYAHFYPKAMSYVFSASPKKKLTEEGKSRVRHVRNNTYKTKKHNVRIETVFSKIKDRVDDFRGLKALWSAPILLQGIILQHNYIEAHTTTGRIPSELAGLKMKLGNNRWLGIIKKISTN